MKTKLPVALRLCVAFFALLPVRFCLLRGSSTMASMVIAAIRSMNVCGLIVYRACLRLEASSLILTAACLCRHLLVVLRLNLLVCAAARSALVFASLLSLALQLASLA
jgi:hypothetical protein